MTWNANQPLLKLSPANHLAATKHCQALDNRRPTLLDTRGVGLRLPRLPWNSIEQGHVGHVNNRRPTLLVSRGVGLRLPIGSLGILYSKVRRPRE